MFFLLFAGMGIAIGCEAFKHYVSPILKKRREKRDIINSQPKSKR